MKQTLTIELEVREGYKLQYNPETQTITEVKVEKNRSKSWKEFCKNNPGVINEWFITSDGEVIATCSCRCGRNTINNLATKEDAEGILALIQLTRLHDEWVEAGEQTEVSIYVDIYGNPMVSDRKHQHLLDFPTKEMAYEFFSCFRDLIFKAKRFL